VGRVVGIAIRVPHALAEGRLARLRGNKVITTFFAIEARAIDVVPLEGATPSIAILRGQPLHRHLEGPAASYSLLGGQPLLIPPSRGAPSLFPP